MPSQPSFEIETEPGTGPGGTLIAGFADPAVAGFTAVDHLVEQEGTTRIGHVATRDLPDLTPFSAGRPRQPIRLYDLEPVDATVLVSEVFLPL